MSERRPAQERAPQVNFLDPSLRLSFEFDSGETVRYLPDITEREIQTRKEKYRLFLGEVYHKTGSKEAVITIRGILDGENDSRYYTESLLEIANVDMPEIKKLVRHVQEVDEYFGTFDLVGEIHTHPILPQEDPNTDHSGPSEGDIDAYINLYKEGEMTGAFPFIFGIGSPEEDGETVYTFWRVVQKEDRTYDLEQISKKD